ncbi:MAG TPA: hypothetical protein VK175_14015 [Leadbetterella sp.]|nr:hypothetical protein [Leadbetterella sp.]
MNKVLQFLFNDANKSNVVNHPWLSLLHKLSRLRKLLLFFIIEINGNHLFPCN